MPKPHNLLLFTLALGAWLHAAGAAAAASAAASAAVFYDSGTQQFTVKDGHGTKASVAVGTFQDGLNQTGWGMLNIKSSGAFADDVQAFAVGMAEGYLTAAHIHTTFENLNAVTFPHGASSNVLKFLDEQEAWTRQQVKEQGPRDPFWAQVGYLMRQYDGLAAGYAAARAAGSQLPPLSNFAFQLLNGVGDLFQIIPAVDKDARVDWLSLSTPEAQRRHAEMGHCSGLIKLTGNFSELFMAHSSWFTYSNTDRIFKHYVFSFADASTAAQRVSFSSYPGFLESLDDFYMLSSGLGWVQTSNGVLDHSVLSAVKPQSLLAWQRVRVASSMAHSGKEWNDFVSRNHSGTYANQYMVVDFNLFEAGQPLKPGTLWVVEEMPGLIVGGDATETLSRGYWPSYNIPYWPQIYEASGYPAMVAKHGAYFSYEMAPRAQIFRRDQGTVVDMTSFKRIMRYNDYKNDPYSFDGTRQNPMYAICSRGDLDTSHPDAGGCYDTKVTSFGYGVMRGKALAINGPSRSPGAGDLPPFSWDAPAFQSSPRAGLPDTYDFDFVPVFPDPPRTVANSI